MESRVKEIDYLKCVFIILMIIFHLVYIGDKYPYAKQIVYTFHMSAFLIISGYLANNRKDARSFLRKFLWIFIPYACMEAAYTVMSHFLPVRESVAEITPSILLDKIFLHPMGPYWYLHTLILCSLIYYVTFRYVRLPVVSRLVVAGVCLFAVSYWGGLMNFSNALYFLIGMTVSQSGLRFTQLFRATPLAIVPFVILCCFPDNLDRGTLAGVAITWLSISLLLALYAYLPAQARRLSLFIGRNTLVILLFSPIFTMLSKAFLPVFAFDPTGMLFLVTATVFTLSGCIGMAWAMDKMHVSKFFFGKKSILCSFLLLTCICACNNKPYPQSIRVADSLIHSNPDSAVTLLEQLKRSMAFEPEATQMYYQLLTIKAKDKAYITHTSDSLIKMVVKYYEDKKDKERLPEAYYYAGRVYRDLGDAPRALDYFQKALESSNKNTDYRLISLTHNQMGMIFLYQDIYDKALDAFNGAYHYSMISKDSALMVYYLRDIGRANAGLNNVDSTLLYYNKAEQIAQSINNSYLTGIINQEVANIYTQLGEYEKADNAIKASLHTLKKYPAPYYATLADLHFETGEIDSAKYYYTKLLSTGNHYHKQGGYEGLSKIARKQGKYADALHYIDQYLIYTDSIQKTIHTEAVQRVNALYNYQLQEKEVNRLKITAQEQRVWIISLTAFIILILMSILTLNFIRQQRKKQKEMQAERQEEKLKEIAKEQYLSSQEYIAENRKRIEELKEKIQNTESKRDELEKNLEESEKELLELANKQIETKQKIHTLSEAALKDSQIYKDFYHVAGMPNSKDISEKSKITQKDWDELIAAIDKTYDNFTWRLQKLYPKISEQEIRICILLKISINPQYIANLLSRSRQAIDSSRKKLYKSTHNQDGTAKMWDDFIRNF